MKYELRFIVLDSISSHLHKIMETARTQHHRKSYHDLLFTVHRLIIRFNGWNGVPPDGPFIQLLDEHADAKEVVPQPLKGERQITDYSALQFPIQGDGLTIWN